MKERDAHLSIGKAASAAGVRVDTLRYYEKRRLLPRPARTYTGYRMYDEDAVRRVRFIKRAQELGFTLKEIAELLELADGRAGGCGEVRAFAGKKAGDLAAKIRDMRRMKAVLESLMKQCSGAGPVSACPIVESLATEKEKRK
jgi:Hg(II)-responsive transcriptional regulator